MFLNHDYSIPQSLNADTDISLVFRDEMVTLQLSEAGVVRRAASAVSIFYGAEPQRPSAVALKGQMGASVRSDGGTASPAAATRLHRNEPLGRARHHCR